MKQKVNEIIKIQGYSPIFNSIHSTIKDLKKEGYSHAEIKETLQDSFNVDNKVSEFLTKLGY